ncbi:MAG: hypothetical protein ACTSXE_02735 [Candidatus Thorarchaeota archaeon]
MKPMKVRVTDIDLLGKEDKTTMSSEKRIKDLEEAMQEFLNLRNKEKYEHIIVNYKTLEQQYKQLLGVESENL